MDADIEQILQHQTELIEENNSMLKKIRRSQNLSTVFSILKWVVVIGSALGLYYYFQTPILHLFEAYDKLLLDFKGFGTAVNTFTHSQ